MIYVCSGPGNGLQTLQLHMMKKLKFQFIQGIQIVPGAIINKV